MLFGFAVFTANKNAERRSNYMNECRFTYKYRALLQCFSFILRLFFQTHKEEIDVLPENLAGMMDLLPDLFAEVKSCEYML